jgi:hypothetical protein
VEASDYSCLVAQRLPILSHARVAFTVLAAAVAPTSQFAPFITRRACRRDRGAARVPPGSRSRARARPDPACCAQCGAVVDRGSDHDARLAAVARLAPLPPVRGFAGLAVPAAPTLAIRARRRGGRVGASAGVIATPLPHACAC